MSLHSWLQNLRTLIGSRPDQGHRGRRGSLRVARHRPDFEVLEDRLTLSFSPAVSYPVDTDPQAVVTGDFNNDGHLDLATANLAAETVSVLLGDGAGGFGDAINSALGVSGANRVSLTVADFDSDGDDDLAAALYNWTPYYGGGLHRKGVGVFLSNGDGAFGSLSYLPVTEDVPLAVAAGDFNNDGNSDLAVSGISSDDNNYGWIYVWSGNGQGEFAVAPRPAYLYRNPWAAKLAVGDLNGDGNLDAVAVEGEFGFTGGIACLGNGAGGFLSQHVFGTSLYSEGVAIGDFSGDGIPDLVTTGLYGLIGRGDGTFDDPIASNGDAGTGVAVADLNGDGNLDVVTSDYTDTVSEWLGNGNGTLTYAGAYAVGSFPLAITVADFNGDGRPDVATSNADSNTVSVLLNDGPYTPPPPPPPSLRIDDVTIAEGNTGSADAVFTVTLSAASSETITVAYATGNGTATAASDYQAASGALTFAPGETIKSMTVVVIGDRTAEANEAFFVNLSSPTNANIIAGQGIATILDDEPRISIGDVALVEGKQNKTTTFTFTVTLSSAYDQPVTISYRTLDGAATSGSDYIAKTGTLTFAPGETSKTITIEVKGDNKKEANETFYLDLYGLSSNAQFTKNRGIGTVLNDD